MFSAAIAAIVLMLLAVVLLFYWSKQKGNEVRNRTGSWAMTLAVLVMLVVIWMSMVTAWGLLEGTVVALEALAAFAVAGSAGR